MKTFKKIKKKNYMVELAGKKWMFKEIVFTEMSDGKLGLTKDETEKINFSVANAICSSEDKMSTDELEFLCEITATRAIEVSRFVRKSPSTVTRWFDRDKPRELDFGNSLILKQFFWVKIFMVNIYLSVCFATYHTLFTIVFMSLYLICCFFIFCSI